MWITGSYCSWMSMALERHFPSGRSQGLIFFPFFFLLSQEKEEKASQESSEEEEEEEDDQ